jgi:hypothetical protein
MEVNKNRLQYFYCQSCDYSTSKKSHYDEHLLTSKHRNRYFLQKNGTYFCCENCDYVTSKKSNYDKHLITDKHAERSKVNTENTNVAVLSCQHCGCPFKSRTGLWKHSKICTGTKNEVIEQQTTTDKDLIMMLIKQNSELMEILKNGTNNICNNTVNSHNKTFNLQVFLNETCKDAMNMSEFIDTIELNLKDVEDIGENGYVNGVSDVLIRSLKAIEVRKRPVHCTDLKRNVVYIKENDVWEKEDLDKEDNKMQLLLRDVRDKNARLVTKWKELYPTCVTAFSPYTDKYNNIVTEAMGGTIKQSKKEKEDKIISKIAKAVYINKYS